MISGATESASRCTPSRRIVEYWDGDIPWIGIRDATENHGRTIFETKQHISQAGVANSSTRLLPAHTVCLSRTASVGYVVTMGVPMCTSQDFVNWVCGPQLDHRYLALILRLEQATVRRFASGTTHQTVYFPEAKAFHIAAPEFAEQKAIVAVLGALDNKIESNRRLNATCLALAVETYRAACLKASQRLALGDAGKWMSGGTPSTEDSAFWGGDFPWISAASLKSFHVAVSERRLTSAGLKQATNVVPAGTVLMVVRGMSLKSELRMGVAQRPVAFGQDCKAIIPTVVPSALLATALYSARSDILELVDEAGHGTGRLQWDLLSAFPIAIPNDDRLVQMLDALLARGAVAAAESRKLAELRDALLPELLSGRIRVPVASEAVDQALA
jgi:type I restriction enzyme S subunit